MTTCKICKGARRSLGAILKQIDDCTYRLSNLGYDSYSGDELPVSELAVLMAETLIHQAMRELHGECQKCSVTREKVAA